MEEECPKGKDLGLARWNIPYSIGINTPYSQYFICKKIEVEKHKWVIGSNKMRNGGNRGTGETVLDMLVL